MTITIKEAAEQTAKELAEVFANAKAKTGFTGKVQ